MNSVKTGEIFAAEIFAALAKPENTIISDDLTLSLEQVKTQEDGSTLLSGHILLPTDWIDKALKNANPNSPQDITSLHPTIQIELVRLIAESMFGGSSIALRSSLTQFNGLVLQHPQVGSSNSGIQIQPTKSMQTIIQSQDPQTGKTVEVVVEKDCFAIPVELYSRGIVIPEMPEQNLLRIGRVFFPGNRPPDSEDVDTLTIYASYFREAIVDRKNGRVIVPNSRIIAISTWPDHEKEFGLPGNGFADGGRARITQEMKAVANNGMSDGGSNAIMRSLLLGEFKEGQIYILGESDLQNKRLPGDHHGIVESRLLEVFIHENNLYLIPIHCDAPFLDKAAETDSIRWEWQVLGEMKEMIITALRKMRILGKDEVVTENNIDSIMSKANIRFAASLKIHQ